LGRRSRISRCACVASRRVGRNAQPHAKIFGRSVRSEFARPHEDRNFSGSRRVPAFARALLRPSPLFVPLSLALSFVDHLLFLCASAQISLLVLLCSPQPSFPCLLTLLRCLLTLLSCWLTLHFLAQPIAHLRGTSYLLHVRYIVITVHPYKKALEMCICTLEVCMRYVHLLHGLSPTYIRSCFPFVFIRPRPSMNILPSIFLWVFNEGLANVLFLYVSTIRSSKA